MQILRSLFASVKLVRQISTPGSVKPSEMAIQAVVKLTFKFHNPFENEMFLMLVDAHSKWIETFVTHGSTSSIVI